MSTAIATGTSFTELHLPLAPPEAVVEAERCLDCGGPYAPAPCSVACPADVDVPSFVGALAQNRPGEAAATILAENLLGGTCARVCPVELLCEGSCVLVHEGRPPIQIAALQRFATDWAFEEGILPRRVTATPTGKRVAVIGAGPAGMACAGELAALGHAVEVYDGREEVGGLVRFGIAPYRQHVDPLPAEARLVESLGVELRLGEAIESSEALRHIEDDCDAVVLAVGLGADLEPELPGSELPGVWRSLEFIEALKTGHTPEVGARTVVIGGGNTAVDVAREAVRLGAEVVTLAYRRTEAEMPAYDHEVEEAREEGVTFHWLSAPTRFLGEHRLTGVECSLMQLGQPDESGRRRPEAVPGSEFVIPADTAVVAIGQQPRRDLLSWIDDLELDGSRMRVDGATGRTGNPKYYAAGDAISGGATVVQAVRDAKIAARAIDEQLRSIQ